MFTALSASSPPEHESCAQELSGKNGLLIFGEWTPFRIFHHTSLGTPCDRSWIARGRGKKRRSRRTLRTSRPILDTTFFATCSLVDSLIPSSSQKQKLHRSKLA